MPPRRPGSSASVNSSTHSLANSNRSVNQRKPLIDINALTGPNKRPLESGRSPEATSPASTISSPFTPGATLFSAGTVTSAAVSPTPPASLLSPQMASPNSTAIALSHMTSKTPPTNFMSPFPSPTKELPPSLAPTAPVIRKSPMRKDTDSSKVSSVSDQQPEKKRDMLNERLHKIVLQSVSSSPSSSPVIDPGTSKYLKGERARSNDSSPVIPPAARQSPATKHRRTASDNAPPKRVVSVDENIADLASMLGAGIRLISREGEEGDPEEEQKSPDEEDKPLPSPTRIAPIPIKQRAPAPSFSVTSRPKQPHSADRASFDGSNNALDALRGPRQRSSTLIPTSTPSSSSSSPAPIVPSSSKVRPGNAPRSSTLPVNNAMLQQQQQPISGNSGISRQRNNTMMPLMPTSSSSLFPMPPSKPFVAPERKSPASSTGGSSSGRAPLTPRDGSEIGSGSASNSAAASRKDNAEDQWSGGASGLGLGGPRGKHAKRHSVSFEEDARSANNQGNSLVPESLATDEARRRERRRSEAKAAIEVCFTLTCALEQQGTDVAFVAGQCHQWTRACRR